MAFAPPPPSAAWEHRDARTGFEVVYFHESGSGWRAEGCTTAVEDGRSCVVEYRIELDQAWSTRHARVSGRTVDGSHTTVVEADGVGRWRVDGQPAPHLDGCFDVDLESSAVTNAFPVHRLDLAPGWRADAPAAYIRALDLTVERLEQTYTRTDDARSHGYRYTAPAFDVACLLRYDGSGLVLDYPGIAVRVHVEEGNDG